ncbi:hypothetical protein FB567DRAFT_610247 [Paraphoma chrysanthemicola]|uniref:Uncharacterized protein n=1 Tax=Paraphoma chrysanthemicola TaxID=798071 RepID=A0A8K0RI07_9PLEO|nr:hypothetical protein FB567DRAFT_610247 [Paraphoma chrysanthemicola]
MASAGYPEKLASDVHETERDDTPTPPVQKPRHFWEKLGVYNLSVLTLGTIAIALALGFLAFLWGSAAHARHFGTFPEVWYEIASTDMMKSTVTLSSVLIRVATAAQLGVFAAIVAALILERVGVPTEDLPLISMIRCLNSGPHSLALSIFNSIFTGALLPYSALIIVAILNAFALQFTSTILLQDFNDTSVVRPQQPAPIAFGIDEYAKFGSKANPYGGTDYWKNGPSSYPRFAEYKEAGSTGVNWLDTGKTYRGFLPFREASARSELRSYTGPMMILDARVVCVKPTVSNISVDFTNPDESILSATYDWNNTHPDLTPASADKNNPNYVNCTLPFPDWFLKPQLWASSLCDVGSPVRLLGGITPDNTDPSKPFGHTSAHLVFNVTGKSDDWQLNLEEGTELEVVQSTHPLWTTIARGNISLDISMCFFNPQPANYNASASAEKPGQDFELGYSRTNGIYDTKTIREAFGATEKSRTPAERGLFQLHSVSNWTEHQAKAVYNKTSVEFFSDSIQRDTNGAETAFFDAYAPAANSIHRSHAAIVQQILQTTRNPAAALQTLWTILLQMAYYDFLPEYDLTETAHYDMAVNVNVPVGFKAFGVVMGLIFVHFVLMVSAVALFLTRTEMSLLGNSWQVVSQVMSTDTADVVQHGATASDKEVKQSMKDTGIVEGRIRITKSLQSGRAEATAVRRRHGATYSTPAGHV